jgi:hypothetical protein
MGKVNNDMTTIARSRAGKYFLLGAYYWAKDSIYYTLYVVYFLTAARRKLVLRKVSDTHRIYKKVLQNPAG